MEAYQTTRAPWPSDQWAWSKVKIARSAAPSVPMHARGGVRHTGKRCGCGPVLRHADALWNAYSAPQSPDHCPLLALALPGSAVAICSAGVSPSSQNIVAASRPPLPRRSACHCACTFPLPRVCCTTRHIEQLSITPCRLVEH